MATNRYFSSNFSPKSEQRLLDSLVREAIKIHGDDYLYLPRRSDNTDKVYDQDPLHYFDSTYEIEMYLKSFDGFTGDGSFMSKFGLEIRDQMILTVSRISFEEEITQHETTITRPREGDLIYFPLNEKLFEIKYVNAREYFYQLGHMPSFEITCELFEYASEKFTTGIETIDNLQKNFSMDTYDYSIDTEDSYMLLTETGHVIMLEKMSLDDIDKFGDNEAIDNEADDYLDFSDKDPFSFNGKFWSKSVKSYK